MFLANRPTRLHDIHSENVLILSLIALNWIFDNNNV